MSKVVSVVLVLIFRHYFNKLLDYEYDNLASNPDPFHLNLVAVVVLVVKSELAHSNKKAKEEHSLVKKNQTLYIN